MSDDGILVHPIQKVTALITRDAATGRELLIFRRPDDGTIQVPAGTVEDGEPPDDAVLRETAEETGLTAVRVIAKLAVETVPLSHNARLLMTDQLLRSTPTSPAAPDALLLKRGLTVMLIETSAAWARIHYRESSYNPTTKVFGTLWEAHGWLSLSALTQHVVRHFYHLTPTAPTSDQWTVIDSGDDERILELYWQPLDGETHLLPSQAAWVEQYRARIIL